jgi:hypothetical protein
MSHLPFAAKLQQRLISCLVVLSSGPILILFGSCAHQVMPQGGPPDTEPPRIVSTYPAPFTTHFADKRIALEFDEYVDQRSVEESIFISPYVGELEFDWSGTEVEVSFSEQLRRNTTYVVNVGTDVKDLRNQNRMAQAFTLAFSTGDEIDHGAIKGRVFTRNPNDPPEGVMIFAYLLENLNPDTVNPQTTKPDYITQTGKGGDFFLKHLAFGSYRIVAVRDEYRNLVYDQEVDEFGVPFTEISLTPTDTLAAGIFIRLSKEDTTRPRLIGASARDRNHVIAEFSEYVDTSSLRAQDFSVLDTLSRNYLSVRSVFLSPGKTSSFTLVTDHQDSTRGYRLLVRSAKDSAGNEISPIAKSIGFGGSGREDTVGLRFGQSSVRDSSTQVSTTAELRVTFTDAVKRANPSDIVQLKDSLGQGVPITAYWQNDVSITIVPQRRLVSLMWHRLIVETGKLVDWSGRPPKDSTKVIRFETMDADVLSGIEGEVVDRDSKAEGKIIIRAESVGQPKDAATVTIAKPGSFALADLREGRYVISAFRDANGNGQFDPGKPFPYLKAERFVVYPDTLRLRARWPLEGVRLELP